MEIRILEERANPLLQRHELRFEISHASTATPTRDSVRTELAKAVHAAKDRVIIERMHPRFGTAVTRGDANVYDTADSAKSISREHILVRNGLKEKAVKGQPAAAAEAPQAGAPASEAPAAPAPANPEAKDEAPSGPKAEPKEAPAAPHGKEDRPAPHAKDESKPKGTSEDAPKHPRPHAKKE
jgi:small subunit ribosomal protein S24e